MKRRTRVLSLVLCFILVYSIMPVGVLAAATFSDVKTTDWYYSCVSYAANTGLINGIGNNKFDPNGAITRAAFVTILHRMEKSPSVSSSKRFSDVIAGSYYENAVKWAYQAGIVAGKTATTFDPEGKITREDMALMLYRYARYKGYKLATNPGNYLPSSISSATAYFSDKNKVQAYARDAVNWTVAMNIISGTSPGILSPQDTATRAQAAVILVRFLETVPPKGSGSEAWRKAYINHINEVTGNGTYLSTFTFDLIYLDDNDVPELVILPNLGLGAGEICTYSGGKVVYASTDGTSVTYHPRQGLFETTSGRQGSYTDYVVRLSGGTFRNVFVGERSESWNTGIMSYSIGGKSVSETAYYNQYRQVCSAGAISPAALSYNGIMRILQNQ